MSDHQSAMSPGQIATFIVTELVLFGVISIGFAVGNYFLAKRLGKSPPLWAILTLIPGFNFIFMYYVFYRVIYGIFDRLPKQTTTSTL